MVGSAIWLELVETLFRRWRWMAIAGALGGVVGVYNVFSTPPLYQAAAKVALDPQRGTVTMSPGASSGVTVQRTTQEEVNEQVDLLQSPDLIREVIQDYAFEEEPEPSGLRLAVSFLNPRYLADFVYDQIHDVAPASLTDRRVEFFQRGLSVVPIRQTDFIEITYTNRRPEVAAGFLNDLLQTYLRRQVDLRKQGAQRTFISEQRKLLGERRDQAEDALREFRERQGLTLTLTDEDSVREMVTSLEGDLSNTLTELQESEARVNVLTREMADLPQEVAAAQDGAVQVLKTTIVDLELERSENLSKYTEQSKVIKDIDRRIAEARELLADESANSAATRSNPTHESLRMQLIEAQTSAAGMQARVAGLRNEIARHTLNLQRMERARPELERLKNDLETAKESYQNYVRKEEEARFSTALDESGILNVNIVENAYLPTNPMNSKRTQKVLMALLVGIAIGGLVGIARDSMDPTLKSAVQAERLAKAPVIARLVW